MKRKPINFAVAGGLVGLFFGLYINQVFIALPLGLALGAFIGYVKRNDIS